MVKRKVANGDDEPTPRAKKAKRSKSQGSTSSVLTLVTSDSRKSKVRDEQPRAANPWQPSDIMQLLTIACVYPAGKAVFELIKVWIDDRKARKIRIKNGDIEIEIQGGITTRDLKKKLDEFRRLTKELSEDDIKIILPSGIDRALPTSQEDKKKRRSR
jgi:hypothetical protein